MTSRVLGLIRDQVLAYFFGAGDAMDAFRIAFRIPNVLRDLFAEGALSAALVPTFTRALAAGDRGAVWRLASNVISVLLLTSGAIVLAGIVFAEPLVNLYAGGFREVPGKLELTIHLTRLMFPFLCMVAVAAVLMAMLNALHHFFVPALSPAMFNVATITCAVLFVPLAPRFGIEPIVAVAAGTLLGGLGQILLQWPTIRREGFRYDRVLDWHDPWLREIGRLMVPGVAGLAAVQINLFVNSWLAAGLGTGAVSWLDYAFRLMYMPIGLFGVSIATASLPAISAHAATSDDTGIRHAVVSGSAPDAAAEPSSHARTYRACHTDRGADLRARALHAGRHRRDGGGARVLCAGPHRVLRGQADFPGLLCHGQQPRARHRQRRQRGAEHLPEPHPRAVAGPSRTGAGHGPFGAAERRHSDTGCFAPVLEASKAGGCVTAVLKISCASIVMAGAAYYTERFLHIPFAGRDVIAQGVRVGGSIAVGSACWPSRPICWDSREI